MEESPHHQSTQEDELHQDAASPLLQESNQVHRASQSAAEVVLAEIEMEDTDMQGLDVGGEMRKYSFLGEKSTKLHFENRGCEIKKKNQRHICTLDNAARTTRDETMEAAIFRVVSCLSRIFRSSASFRSWREKRNHTREKGGERERERVEFL